MTDKQLTRMARERLHELAGTAIDTLQKHMTGDDPALSVRAAETLLGKTVSAARPGGSYVRLPALADPALSIPQRAKVLTAALASGQISIEQHGTLMRSLESETKASDLHRIHALLDLLRKGLSLEAAVAHIEDQGDQPMVIDISPHPE